MAQCKQRRRGRRDGRGGGRTRPAHNTPDNSQAAATLVSMPQRGNQTLAFIRPPRYFQWVIALPLSDEPPCRLKGDRFIFLTLADETETLDLPRANGRQEAMPRSFT